MNLTATLLLSAGLAASAKGHTQTVTLDLKNVPIQRVFREVIRQTGTSIVYNEALFKDAPPVTIQVKDATVAEVIDKCLQGQPYTFNIDNNAIVIKEKVPSPLQMAEGEAPPPPIDVHGKVVNEKGIPVEGVTVTVKGTKNATATDANGMFSLRNVDGNATLVFSGVNVETYEIKVNGRSDFATLSLKTKVIEGEEVKILNNGYQTISKERATGSFFQIDNQLINRSNSTNILDHINYVTSSLDYESKNTGIGGRSVLTIRGVSSINSNQNPLIVVDGFAYDESTNYVDVVNNINPNDVESITVLKDAAAASIWGTRAGNGVIVIVTKRGKFNQKPTVQFNNSVAIGKKPNLYYAPAISSADEIAFEKQLYNTGYYQYYDNLYPQFNYFPVVTPVIETLLAQSRGDITSLQADSAIAEMSKHDIRNDIAKYLNQNSIYQQYALNVSGGSDKFNYYGSIGYDNNRYTSVGIGSTRITTRFENTYRIAKGFEFKGYINYTQSETKDNAYNISIPVYPYAQIADNKGNALTIPHMYRQPYIDTAKYPGLLDWSYSPLNELRNSYNTDSKKQYDIRLGGNLNYTFLPGLSAEIKYQYQKILTNENALHSIKSFYARNLINEYMYVDPSTGNINYPVPVGGVLDKTNEERTVWNFRGQLNFTHTWEKQNVVALAGYESSQDDYDYFLGRIYGYDPNVHSFSTQMNYTDFYAIRASGGSSMQVQNPDNYTGSLNRFLSYYGNLAYTYDSKYTLTASARSDGANLFGVKANLQIKPLWSTGLSWDISKENFFHSNFISYLKLRATYGYSGNINNAVSTYATALYSGSDGLTGAQFAQITTSPNPALQWEEVGMINLGLDFEMVHHRISGSLEYYQKRGTDLISKISIDPTTGFTSYIGNDASIKGNGIDIVLNTKNIDNRFKWYSAFLLSWNSDAVTSYKIVPKASQLAGQFSSPNVGKPLFGVYSYKWAGLSSANGDPQGYVDKQASTDYTSILYKTNPGDLVYNGHQNPTLFGSIRNTLSLSHISMSFIISYKFNYYFRRSSVNYTNLYNNNTTTGDYALRWQKPGDEKTTNVPSLPPSINFSRDQFYTYSAILVDKGDNIRLQDIRVSYDLPKISSGMGKKGPYESAQVYIYMNNIGIIWRANKYGIDPDYAPPGAPTPRSIAMGLTMTF